MKLLATALIGLMATAAFADIQNPPRPGPTRKLGAGVAKILYSSSYVTDSVYDRLQHESATAACTYGVVEGASKAVISTGVGVAEVLTFPFPPYRSYSAYPPFRFPYEVPPADLKENFW
jgi:putative exosortase-associated protein (TIGR04073 family)